MRPPFLCVGMVCLNVNIFSCRTQPAPNSLNWLPKTIFMPRFSFIRSFFRLGAMLGLMLALVLLSSCRPTSGKRESRELLHSDSLSRQIAKKMPIGQLARLWVSKGGSPSPLIHPQTVLFGPHDRIYVADVEANRVFVFDMDGKLVGQIGSEPFKYPYLAGFQGDTVAVLNRGENRLVFFKDAVKVKTITTPEAPMTYALVDGHQIWFKATGGDDRFEGYMGPLKPNGQVGWPRARFSKPRYWRYAGNLRMWNGRLMSLSGFRPVVDFLREDGKLDTLALRGFDSPMLSRSRLFMIGDEWNAPLLSPAAVGVDSSLFVLNLRAGWLRIDRYNTEGKLRQVAETPNAIYQKNFTPMDMDAKRLPDGHVLFAIVYKEPYPSLRLYRW